MLQKNEKPLFIQRRPMPSNTTHQDGFHSSPQRKRRKPTQAGCRLMPHTTAAIHSDRPHGHAKSGAHPPRSPRVN